MERSSTLREKRCLLNCVESDHVACAESDHVACAASDHVACAESDHVACAGSDHVACVESDHVACAASDHVPCAESDHVAYAESDHVACAESDHVACAESDHVACAAFISIASPGRGMQQRGTAAKEKGSAQRHSASYLHIQYTASNSAAHTTSKAKVRAYLASSSPRANSGSFVSHSSKNGS